MVVHFLFKCFYLSMESGCKNLLRWVYCLPLFWQLELIELEGISILAATLAWNDSSLCKFEEAVQTYELSLYQVYHIWRLSSPPVNVFLSFSFFIWWTIKLQTQEFQFPSLWDDLYSLNNFQYAGLNVPTEHYVSLPLNREVCIYAFYISNHKWGVSLFIY